MVFEVSLLFPELGDQYFRGQAEAGTCYEAAEEIGRNWKNLPHASVDAFSAQPIETVMPIHNTTGIRDTKQITGMAEMARSGQAVLHQNGLPNCKLVVAPDGRLLLFDGHHTLLAYYETGKRTLGEVPHLVVSLPNGQPIPPVAIAAFFPTNDREKVATNWAGYTVNWQAGDERKLETRTTQTVGELAAALGERDKSSSE